MNIWELPQLFVQKKAPSLHIICPVSCDCSGHCTVCILVREIFCYQGTGTPRQLYAESKNRAKIYQLRLHWHFMDMIQATVAQSAAAQMFYAWRCHSITWQWTRTKKKRIITIRACTVLDSSVWRLNLNRCLSCLCLNQFLPGPNREHTEGRNCAKTIV